MGGEVRASCEARVNACSEALTGRTFMGTYECRCRWSPNVKSTNQHTSSRIGAGIQLRGMAGRLRYRCEVLPRIASELQAVDQGFEFGDCRQPGADYGNLRGCFSFKRMIGQRAAFIRGQLRVLHQTQLATAFPVEVLPSASGIIACRDMVTLVDM